MNKRPGFIVTILVFIAAIVGFYIFLKKQQNPSIVPISAVPINAALIIEIKQPLKFYQDISQTNAVFKKIAELKEAEDIFAKYKRIDTLIASNTKLLQLFSKTPLLISLHDIGNKEFYPLYTMAIGGRYESNQILNAIELVWNTNNTITSERYNKVKLYKISNGKEQFYYSYNKGLLLGSKSEILLEDAIRQSETTENLLNIEELTRLMETSGDHAPANLYIQFKYFENYLNKIISETFLDTQSINQIGDWLELDLNIKNQTLLFNGFAYSDATANRFMNLFQGQTPQNIKFLSFIPTEAKGFWGFGLSSYSLYKQNLRKYMEQIGEIDRYEVNHKTIREAFGERADTDLEIIFRNEVAQVAMPDETTLFYIKTQGYRDGTELILKWLSYYCENTNQNINDYKSDYSIDKESVFPIYKMPVDYLPTRIFGPYFKTCKANYVTVFDDYIIFGDSYSSLSKIIYNNVLQKTLVYDAAFTQYSDYLSSKVNFFGLISLTGADKVLESIMNGNAFKYYKKNQNIFNDLYAVAWQFAAENNLYYNNVLFSHQPTNSLKAATDWETKLDTILAFKPEFMINHLTNEKEIFVQDEKHNIYLINKSGRVLWKKNIEAPIMGEVFQVDYYKNGKYQYLFNTKTKIHLLDRNGNFVERYPISLSAPAAASLNTFDYEKTKNYRLFIPLENNKIEVYNIEGKIVSGFKFQKTDNKIISAIQYVRDKNNEYIIVTDESRIYILDRQGNTRVNPKMQFNASMNNQFEYQAGNSGRPSRLVRTDIAGTVYYVYLNGEVEAKKIYECSPNHYFNVEDVTGDKVKDFIFIDNNELAVFSLTGQNIYNYKFSSSIYHKPSFYKFSANNTYIGVTEGSARKIYLFDSMGNILTGFPKTGNTQFSIGVLESSNNLFQLIVGGDDYYLYNYKLN